MIGTSETWLKPTIAERESLSESYRFVARRGRPNSSHGGVAVIAWHDLEASEIDLHSTVEIVATSFTCKDLKKPIIVGSLYRPTDNNLYYSQELCTYIQDSGTISSGLAEMQTSPILICTKYLNAYTF